MFPWWSHSHENSTSRPHQNHQDFTARIHLGKFTRICASIKTGFRHCSRVSGTTSCVHPKDVNDHFCAATKSQNSQGNVANNKVSSRFHFSHGLVSIKRYSARHHQSACVQTNSGKASQKHLRFIHWVEVVKLHSNIIGTFKFRSIRFSQISFSSYFPNIVPSQGHWGCFNSYLLSTVPSLSSSTSMRELTACLLAITQC